MVPPTYKRILLKISGEVLMGGQAYGIDLATVGRVADEVMAVAAAGAEVALVIGGGNIFRGIAGAAKGMDRVSADHMGIMATVMNALAMRGVLAAKGADARVLSAIAMPTVCEIYSAAKGRHHLEKGRIVICAAGTGLPFPATPGAAVLFSDCLREPRCLNEILRTWFHPGSAGFMIFGFKSRRALFARHAAIGALAGLVFYLFWLSRPDWSSDMRLWRAVGDAGFMFLFLALIIGPMARLWRPALRALSWRREFGIWFGLLALTHGTLVANGWAQWDVMRFLGYEFIPELSRYSRLEPGFGLANLLGLAALFSALVLVSTSSDRAVNFFGISSWKWLHTGAYVVFYLAVLHVLYFMFIHFTPSIHRDVPPPNWFRYPLLILALVVVALQMSAFAKTVSQQRRRLQSSGPRTRQQWPAAGSADTIAG